uniref:Mannose receptor, C type 1b n=1 Tax=Seriola dumerili TaxID=41447 RepID=A0A3B4UJN7_SERDU
FVLQNIVATGFCLLKKFTRCLDVRWTTSNRLYAVTTKKCLGVQGKSVGSEVSLYDCNDKSDLQKWECKNGTLLALKGQELYVEIKPDETIALSKTIGPNNHLTITGTSSGACTRTYRELYTIEGNAFGKPCMFPFMYKDRWFGDCTTFDSSQKRLWCAIETKYEREQWGYCPTTSRDHWMKNLVTGANYQLNPQALLTWPQAQASCKQQGASLVSITDPHERAYISGKVQKLWTGLVLDPEHGWQWSDGKPFRYLRWGTGNPLPNPGHNCAFLDSAGQHTWQSSSCVKKMGYICYNDGTPPAPPQIEQGFCSSPWIPYNGHCFHLQRTPQTWMNAQKECRKEHGDLVSIRNVEDQSFVISQLGYTSTDELWIGLNDRKTEGLFDWSDQSTVSFTSWKYGKPAVSTAEEDCVLITGEKGNWADRLCDEKHGFICMKESETERTGDEVELDIGCKAGWKRHGSYCYFVGTETKTFDEAKNDCKSSESYLADVSNGVDNAFLVSLVGLRPEKYFWLGLSNQKDIDQFVWTNTDSVRFTHWNAEMPGHRQGCVAMTTGILAGLWDLLPCTNQEKYICKHLAEGAVLTVPPPTQTPPSCADGWTRVGTRNVCSKFFTGPRANEKTWFEARDYCRAIGGDLLSIHSPADLLVGRHGKGWIGLHVPDPNTGYVWSDGSPVNFQHWQEGEPNNFNNAESCAEYKIYNWDESGSWNDVNCESYNDWLCQIRQGTVEKTFTEYSLLSPLKQKFNTTSDGWLVWRGNQYYINRMSMPMEDARHFCQRRHGDLVSISSKDENVFLWKQVGFWRTCNCGQEHQSICKRGSSPPVNTTAAPTIPPKGDCPLKWTKFDSKVRSGSQCALRALFILIITIFLNIFTFLITKMAEVANTDLWIGLNGIKHDGFYWTDGKPRRYTNWGYSVIWEIVSSKYDTEFVNNWLNCKTLIYSSCDNNSVRIFVLLSTDSNIPAKPEPIVPTVYVALGNDSIKAVTQNLTWGDAKRHCEGEQASLASLRNEWTQAYVELLAMNLKSPLWIGLNKNQTGGYFRYTDGWHLNFASWAEGEPSRERPCVYLDVDGKWKTALCNRTMNSVCMQSTDVAPTESTNFPGVCPEEANADYQQSYTWMPFKGHCYLFITDETEWPNAASNCARHGGSLATIEDPSEQQFLQSNVEMFQDSHTSFWIGLYKTHKGTWMWLDKTVMDYTNWAEDEPDSEFGAISTSDGIWKTGRRWHDRPYICKTPKEPHGGQDPRSRVHTSLVVVLIIAITSSLIVIAFFLYKKSPRPLPTFDNPLYFDSERSQPDVVDTNKLIENAEVENPEPIITL